MGLKCVEMGSHTKTEYRTMHKAFFTRLTAFVQKPYVTLYYVTFGTWFHLGRVVQGEGTRTILLAGRIYVNRSELGSVDCLVDSRRVENFGYYIYGKPGCQLNNYRKPPKLVCHVKGECRDISMFVTHCCFVNTSI